MLIYSFLFAWKIVIKAFRSVLYMLHCSLPYDAHSTRSMDVMPWFQTDRPEDTTFHGRQPKQGILHAFLLGGMESVRPPQTCFLHRISIPRRFTSSLFLLLLLALQAANIHPPSWGTLTAAWDVVQSEPRSHKEHVHFESGQLTILEDTTRFSCRQSRFVQPNCCNSIKS